MVKKKWLCIFLYGVHKYLVSTGLSTSMHCILMFLSALGKKTNLKKPLKITTKDHQKILKEDQQYVLSEQHICSFDTKKCIVTANTGLLLRK